MAWRPQRRVWSGLGSNCWSQPGEQAPESGANPLSITEPQDTSDSKTTTDLKNIRDAEHILWHFYRFAASAIPLIVFLFLL